jgi:hypothetical protein
MFTRSKYVPGICVVMSSVNIRSFVSSVS